MFPDAITLNAWADNWSAAMIGVLWQSVLWTALVGVVAWLLLRASPAVRCWLWRIVAAKLLLIPLWSLPLVLSWLPAVAEVQRETTHVSPAYRSTPSTEEVAEPSPAAALVKPSGLPPPIQVEPPAPAAAALSWLGWLMIGWGLAVAFQLSVLLRQRLRLAQLLGEARPAGEAIAALSRDCAQRVKLARAPRVLVVERDCSPFVCGVWRPAIVLPRSLAEGVPAESLAPVLVHELAHLKRLDLVWNWIPQLARMFYFFDPLVHWIAFRIRLESELACDS
jgi:bla regulator protein blaR1